MIKIDIYNNAVEINGHANQEICYQVSIASFILANAMGDLGERVSHEAQDNTGYTKIVFNITYDTQLLRNSYERDMRLWFGDFYSNDVIINRIDNEV